MKFKKIKSNSIKEDNTTWSNGVGSSQQYRTDLMFKTQTVIHHSSKPKEKNRVIISIDAKMTFDKI